MVTTIESGDYGRNLFNLISAPTSSAEIAIHSLVNADGVFIVDEGPTHDYKDEYPFSNSDNYFGGIVRLILAFYNTYGGVIIFGVDDKTRRAGRNKVIVDSEKINRKLRETISGNIEIRTSEVETKSGKVQLIIIPSRPSMVAPLYATKDIGVYKSRKIYIRRGAEVLEAKGDDLGFLYGERDQYYADREVHDLAVPASLPPSPATIQEFVGRFSSIEKLFKWFAGSRDPRQFLWGQGGSGKSTIAYEFANLVAQSGAALTNRNGRSLDRILFISGKATYLDPHSGQIREIQTIDFRSAQDIYKTILQLSNWASPQEIESYGSEEMFDALESLFEIETQLIVIDDIDTLTTSNKDAGMEELFQVLSRSRSGTRVLYTQRGFPSFAPNAAIEVPGLEDEEFSQFLDLCCLNYKVSLPSESESLWIKEHSERRPLAIETIVGMRRVSPSYRDAFQRWTENSSEARSYLFSREYQQLSKDDRARHLLAALAIFGSPQSIETLRSVLEFSKEQIEDSIAEVRDMFLKVTHGDKIEGDLYSIGAATRLYIEEVSNQLDRYAIIAARVMHFKSRTRKTPAAFIPIIERAQRNTRLGNVVDAIGVLTNEELPAAFREHPEVKAVLGQAYALQNPPNVSDARRCFESAYTLGYRHYQMYLTWLELEKANRTEVVNGIAVCNRVVTASGFDLKTRAAFQRKLARYQIIRAGDVEMTDPQKSSELRMRSVINNIEAYILVRDLRDSTMQGYRDRSEEAISITLRRSIRFNDVDFYFDLLEEIVAVNRNISEFFPLIADRVDELKRQAFSNNRAVIARLHRLTTKCSASAPTIGEKREVETFVKRLKEVVPHLSA